MRSLYALYLSLSVAIPAIQPRLHVYRGLTAFAPLSMAVSGCLTHLQKSATRPVVHWIELLNATTPSAE
ncbi:MAG: hypothetical protein KZQ60_17145 [Candidatus Thiodiazotropha sp. (ex Lucinoma aequizonata)]|nr:hypothetical protein [Candidatus Thiodiazotropha sp. (ex Lucinoma aequizonata)]